MTSYFSPDAKKASKKYFSVCPYNSYQDALDRGDIIVLDANDIGDMRSGTGVFLGGQLTAIEETSLKASLTNAALGRLGAGTLQARAINPYNPLFFDRDQALSIYRSFGYNKHGGGNEFRTVDISRAQPFLRIHYLSDFSEEAMVLTGLDMNAGFTKTQVAVAKEASFKKRFPDRPDVGLDSVRIVFEEGTGPFQDLGLARIEMSITFFDLSAMSRSPYRLLFATGIPMLVRFGWNQLDGKDYIEEIKCQVFDYSINIDEAGVAHCTFRAYQQGVGVIAYSQLGSRHNLDPETGYRFQRQFEVMNQKLKLAQRDSAGSFQSNDKVQLNEAAKTSEYSMALSSNQGYHASSLNPDKTRDISKLKENMRDDFRQNQGKNASRLLNCVISFDRNSDSDVDARKYEHFRTRLIRRLDALITKSTTRTDKVMDFITFGMLLNEFVVKEFLHPPSDGTFDGAARVLDGIVVGNFNKFAGDFASASMLNYPILVDSIRTRMLDTNQDFAKMSVMGFLDYVIANHILNSDHYLNEKEQRFVKPSILKFLRNVKVEGSTKTFLFIIDRNASLPTGLDFIGLSPRDTVQLQKSQTPSLAIGRRGSPINTMTVELINDPGLQSVIVANNISKQGASSQLQGAKGLGGIPEQERTENFDVDLTKLQFQGTVNMYGIPFLNLYQIIAVDLQTDLWDGLYIIYGLEHKIEPGNFETQIEIRYLHITAMEPIMRRIDPYELETPENVPGTRAESCKEQNAALENELLDLIYATPGLTHRTGDGTGGESWCETIQLPRSATGPRDPWVRRVYDKGVDADKARIKNRINAAGCLPSVMDTLRDEVIANPSAWVKPSGRILVAEQKYSVSDTGVMVTMGPVTTGRYPGDSWPGLTGQTTGLMGGSPGTMTSAKGGCSF